MSKPKQKSMIGFQSVDYVPGLKGFRIVEEGSAEITLHKPVLREQLIADISNGWINW